MQKGKATTEKKLFSRSTTVSIDIEAEQSKVWQLLTSAADYPRWNSTVISIDGRIALGEKLALVSVLDPKRTFKLKVKEFVPQTHIRWGDAMGNRDLDLRTSGKGVTFTMTEKIGGPLFPLFASMIPPFDDAFEKFAKDLKAAAERS